METKINIKKRDYMVVSITLVLGLFFGWLFFHSSSNKTETESVTIEHVHEETSVWTCSMHPQIRMDKPGKCPICGMDLIPLQENTGTDASVSPGEIYMSEAAIKIADIQTMMVQNANPEKKIYLLGKVKPDERHISELTTRFGGRIEKLYVNFTGQDVRKGEKLAAIYSPALVTAQKELLEAMDYKQSNPEFYNAARNKLKLWDLNDDQIDDMENQDEVQSYFDVLSPVTGTVTKRNVTTGDYIKEGSALFQVVDLTTVWVMFDAYESDLSWIKPGDVADFTVKSLPGKNFSGRVTFIDPLIDPLTRVARARLEVQNPGLLLKPEMFANGVINSSIAGNSKELMIPRSSILWTGKRSVVYVKSPDREQPVFRYREIVLGPSAGDFYIVKSGLSEGEEIAVNGVFKIDAAAQLAGKTSMMNQEAEIASVDPAFKKQLQEVYDSYLLMKNAFVASDTELIREKAHDVNTKLMEVNMELLKGDSHMKWMNYQEKMKPAISAIEAKADLPSQRTAFAEFNEAFHESVESFGLNRGTVFYQYCPMANGNNGAYWLSEISEIRNPYFGDKMLTCGETRDTLYF